VAGDYQVKVARDIAGYDDYGLPGVTRIPARIVIVAALREMVFGSREAIDRFVDACRRAADEAFDSPSPQDVDHAAAWCRFYERILKL
jgi:hypothetical protein